MMINCTSCRNDINSDSSLHVESAVMSMGKLNRLWQVRPLCNIVAAIPDAAVHATDFSLMINQLINTFKVKVLPVPPGASKNATNSFIGPRGPRVVQRTGGRRRRL